MGKMLRYGSILTGLGLVLAMAIPSGPGARAAAFCVQTRAIPPQCIYADAAACNARARQMGGYCTANEAELHVVGGIGHFCVLSSGIAASCIYLDRASCDVAAQRQNAVCVAAPAPAESPAADPFRSIRPLTSGVGTGD